MNKKDQRLLYIRLLEKFFRQTVNTLKHEEVNYVKFKTTIRRLYESIDKEKSSKLYSAYLQELESFVTLTINSFSEDNQKSWEQERLTLLKKANLLHKQKRKKQYHKQKHKLKTFQDE